SQRKGTRISSRADPSSRPNHPSRASPHSPAWPSRPTRPRSRSPATRSNRMAPLRSSPARASNSKAMKSTNGLRNMRIRLKGINSVPKRLADGTWKTYYYAWKGGPPLRGEPGTPEFVASYNESVARKVVTPQGTLQSPLRAFEASAEFSGLAERTRVDYV